MSAPLVLFYLAAAVALGAAVQLLRSQDPTAAARWFAVTLVAVAAVEVLLLAPWVALAAAFAGLSIFALFTFVGGFTGSGGADRGARRRRLGLALGVLLLGLLAWVLVGTWARQLAFPGHDLAPGAAFGGLRQLSTELGGELGTLAFALPLLLFTGALGAVGLVSRGEADDADEALRR